MTRMRPRRARSRRSWPRLASAHGALLRAGLRAGLGVGLLLGTSCGLRARPPFQGPVRALEQLGFVAPGRFETYPGSGYVLESDAYLLVDLFEVTREDWLRFMGTSAGDGLDWTAPDDWSDPATGRWPATGMNLAEAEAYAASRDMRLPTVLEWGWFAVGRRGQTLPYGLNPMKAAANTQIEGVGRLVPVGTFLRGRSTGAGLLDLVGNAAELAVDPPQDSWGAKASRYLADPRDEDPLDAWAMGGSYRDEIESTIYQGSWLFARKLEAEHRASDVGLRCVVDADAWLRTRLEPLSRLEWRPRITAVGERWGRTAQPLLDRLAAEFEAGEGVPFALDWLLEGARR